MILTKKRDVREDSDKLRFCMVKGTKLKKREKEEKGRKERLKRINNTDL